MTDTRAFEMTLEIAIAPEAVWHAITDPAEIVRWFASRAEVTPGAGGTWFISWDGNWPWKTHIEIWEPNRHLRIVDRTARPYDVRGEAPDAAATPMSIAIDWYIEGSGGTTTLRLVHSGFGRGRAWDDEFDGVSTGWPLELNALKHYLERHRGEARQVAWTRTVVPAQAGDPWQRLAGRGGIIADASLAALRPGDRYETSLSTGDRIEGRIVMALPGRGVQVTIEPWNDALYRVWIDRVGDEWAVNSWLSTYEMPESFAAEFNARMQRELERLGGGPAQGRTAGAA